jgi:hypothetical protein
MKSEQIVEALQGFGGQHISACWSRQCKVKKGSPKIVKRTIAHIRSGIDYAKLGSVQRAIEAKQRGEVQPIWGGKGQWVEFPFIFRHIETGAEYVRLYPASFKNLVPDVTYFRDGEPVELEEIKSFLYADEIPETKEEREAKERAREIAAQEAIAKGEIPKQEIDDPCFCLKVESVETIGI